MRTTVSAVLLVLALGTLGTTTATAQDLRVEIAEVTARLQAAGAANLNLIAPQAYTKARQKITEAESVYQHGANPKDVRKKLDEARVELARAESLKEMGDILLGSALTARTDALVADAPANRESEKSWRDGEKALNNAGRKVESGDRNSAVQEATKAEAAYREAEYEALRKALVAATEGLRQTAKDRDAHKKAATTFLRADTELAAAEAALRANRKDQSEAIAHAIASADGYRRASRIALMVDAVKRNANTSVEKLVLDYEGYMSDAAQALNFTADFRGGPQPVSTQLIDAITSLTEDRDALRAEASSAGLALAALQAGHDSLVFTSDSLAARLTMRVEGRPGGVVGVNIGCNRDTADPLDDYRAALARLGGLADYVAVNISSPNTPGLRDLQDPDRLDDLVGALRRADGERPLLVKIAPDLSDAQRRAIVELAVARRVDGLIVSNTTIERPAGLRSAARDEAGGLSGRPLFEPSTRLLSEIYRDTGGAVPLIGVGGISSGADAYAKIRAGASLVQLYTALIYEGFGLVRRIKADLAARLAADGFASVSEAVGVDAEKAAR